MFAQLPHSKTARLLAALALTLTLGLLAGGASNPASADASQWTRSQSQWGSSTGWERHWRSNQSHHRNQFDNRSQIIIGGGSGVIITRPAFVIGNPSFVVRQPAFIIGQTRFVVRQPNFIFERPSFAKKQWQFIKRHPSLRVGKPWWHNNWSHKRWKHKRWKHQMHNGMN
ncbi:MAG: hypothetical protein HC861_08245 [Rhodospirillaceae bacterium]|nr:hypothetical protein [Rhodospirillaceae bacterium]